MTRDRPNPGVLVVHPGVRSVCVPLEKSQVSGKGGTESSPLYLGMEVIQTGGGPQLMKVVYSVARLEKSQVSGKGPGESRTLYTGMEVGMTDQGAAMSVSARVTMARAPDPYTAARVDREVL